jgi:hypothetical protein
MILNAPVLPLQQHLAGGIASRQALCKALYAVNI